ncbi:hypothetical protein, partial [Metallibacterium scheffleri]|uniref:hypothetical protein n=1 Tax=Metallibacterium scheffleri TaxID=993689 RepID=UPI001B397D5E
MSHNDPSSPKHENQAANCGTWVDWLVGSETFINCAYKNLQSTSRRPCSTLRRAHGTLTLHCAN